MPEKVLGIIGGMGPEATVDFMNRVIKLTPASDDQDHIRMIVDNYPQIPSRIKALLENTGPDPTDTLIKIARNLEKWGANLIAIPCNTAHYYFEAISNSTQIPVLNMLTLVAEFIKKQHSQLKTVGFLGSTAVIKTGLYDKVMQPRSIKMVYPDTEKQHLVMLAIRKIKTGVYTDNDLMAVVDAAENLMQSGAEVLIIGCTELSATSHLLPSAINFYDASQVLAAAVVETIKGSSKSI